MRPTSGMYHSRPTDLVKCCIAVGLENAFELSQEPVITENLVRIPTPSAGETDRGCLEAAEQRSNRVLDHKAGSKEKSGVGPRGDCFGLQDDRMLSDTIVAEGRLTFTTRPGAGIGDEVLRPEK